MRTSEPLRPPFEGSVDVEEGVVAIPPPDRAPCLSGSLAGLLGGTFFAVVTFLSDPAVSERTARGQPKLMREANKEAPFPQLFETRVGPPLSTPRAGRRR